MGRILIANLTFDCVIGILPSERLNPQPLQLDIELEADFTPAAASDNIEDTADYAAVGSLVRTLAEEKQYQLVEKLVTDACDQVLMHFPTVLSVKITARKPRILADTDYVGASVRKQRG